LPPAIKIGARWDDASQRDRFARARGAGLLDYAEVNYPIGATEDPSSIELPILAHSSTNPLASARGLDPAVMQTVKAGADAADSEWVGEHLAWNGFADSGTLGYVISPLFSEDFCEVAVENARSLGAYYGRPLAIELGPVYARSGDFESEMHFLAAVARAADAHVILDVTHWMISNHNLQRPEGYGLDALDADRVIELHISGFQAGKSSRHWHDAHFLAPTDEQLDVVAGLARSLPRLRGITVEHAPAAPEADFVATLERLHTRLR